MPATVLSTAQALTHFMVIKMLLLGPSTIRQWRPRIPRVPRLVSKWSVKLRPPHKPQPSQCSGAGPGTAEWRVRLGAASRNTCWCTSLTADQKKTTVECVQGVTGPLVTPAALEWDLGEKKHQEDPKVSQQQGAADAGGSREWRSMIPLRGPIKHALSYLVASSRSVSMNHSKYSLRENANILPRPTSCGFHVSFNGM